MDPLFQQKLLKTLAELCDLSPEVRFGQMLDHLGLLCEDRADTPMVEIEDQDLLKVFEHHREEMSRRQSHVA